MATVRVHRGKWVADFRDQHGRRRHEVPKGRFSTKALEKRAAQELLARRLEELREKRYRAFGEKPAFSRLADLFLASKVRARKTTIDGYRELIDCYLRPYFGTQKADEITSFDIEQFRDEMAVAVPMRVQEAREQRERELRATNPEFCLRTLRPGPRTTNKSLTLLVGIMGYGCRHKFVNGNPALKLEKLKEPEGESRVIEENVLTPAELRQAIDAAIEPWRSPIMFGVFTGARRSEIVGLQ
jgi:integrase